MHHAVEATNITAGINEARFLGHLKELFSTKTTVLAELMQNARRAKAAHVSFTFAEPSTLEVIDNGCGISSFAALVTVAESGWSEAQMQSEAPFGIGFFSVCFSTERVLVQSRGKEIGFTADDLIAKRPIAIRASDFIGGTRIVLEGFRLTETQTHEALRQYARGFAIPVLWDGEALDRPFDQANLDGIATQVGFVHLPGYHDDQVVAHYSSRPVLFCQGLPIYGNSYCGRDQEYRPIVHLDHLRYKPRMPDRDSLIDLQDALADINAECVRLWRERMDSDKRWMSATDFVTRYWQLAKTIDCLDVMNDVPVLPVHCLSQMDAMPSLGENLFYRTYPKPLTQSEIESGTVTLFREVSDLESGDAFPRMVYAWQSGWVCVQDLPEQHWATQYTVVLDDAELKIEGATVSERGFGGLFVNADLKLMEQLVVSLNGQPRVINQAVCIGIDWEEGLTLLIPQSAANPGDVLDQASAYLDGNDHYDEAAREEDERCLVNLVAIMKGEPAATTVEKLLRHAGATYMESLSGKSLRLTFGADGQFEIVELPT